MSTGALVVVVVAAGAGSRFGGESHKLAQSIHAGTGGTTVLGATLQHAVESRLEVVVVTTEPFAALARSQIAARDVIVLPGVLAGEFAEADHAASHGASKVSGLGMGHSIRAGVLARPDAAGWIVLPGDMPTVRATTVQAVARELSRHSIAYAQYRGRRGHPVGFAAEYYSELAQLSGDQGARRLIARFAAHAIEIDDPGVLVDVDTPADLEWVRQRQATESTAPGASFLNR